MDNRKWYNRFATIFWWFFTILPIITALIYFIGFHFAFNSGITSATDLIDYQTNSDGDFQNYLVYVLEDFYLNISFPPFYNMFSGLADTINIPNSNIFGMLFAWMTSVQFYHLIFDFIVWLPKWFHAILEKGFDKLS